MCSGADRGMPVPQIMQYVVVELLAWCTSTGAVLGQGC